MIAAGCARKLVFSWAGNPGAGPLYALRRAVEQGLPQPLELEEYSHFGMVARFQAGAARLPFLPLRTFTGSDLPQVNERIREVECPYTGERLATVPALNPDVAIIHVQRADRAGNCQVWGLLGVQKEAAFAASKVIVVAEEIVDEAVIRADPNRTLLPGFIVSAVVHEPWGCHPSFAQGYYDRDNDFYVAWREISQDAAKLDAWLDGVGLWAGRPRGVRAPDGRAAHPPHGSPAVLGAGELWLLSRGDVSDFTPKRAHGLRPRRASCATARWSSSASVCPISPAISPAGCTRRTWC